MGDVSNSKTHGDVVLTLSGSASLSASLSGFSDDESETSTNSSLSEPDIPAVQIENLERFLVPESEVSAMPKKVRGFYERQNALIESFRDAIAAQHVDFAMREAQIRQLGNAARVAVLVSLAGNIMLLAAKIVVAVRSGSVVVLAAALDSALDLFSSTVMFIASRVARTYEKFKYPAGTTRAEPIAVIVVSSVMLILAVQILIQALQRLISRAETPPISTVDLIIIGMVVLVKIVLFFFCIIMGRSSPAAATLALDHRNDVLSNGFSLIAIAISSRCSSCTWVDPSAAIVFSLIIMVIWLKTGLEYSKFVLGRSAPPEFLQVMTMMCLTVARVDKVETIRAHHVGLAYLVEVDIVMDPSTDLRTAHDTAQTLQFKLEKVPSVERAIVHVDWEWSHHERLQKGWAFRM